MRQTTCNWIKILDETTRIVNVFLISWFFHLFLLCSISLLVKYDVILRYEAWLNAIRASSFIENFPQISAKPIAFQLNLLGKLTKPAVLYQSFFSEAGVENSCKIGRLFTELAPENPAKIDFFLRDLPEALPKLVFVAFRSLWLTGSKNYRLESKKWNVSIGIQIPFFFSKNLKLVSNFDFRFPCRLTIEI